MRTPSPLVLEMERQHLSGRVFILFKRRLVSVCCCCTRLRPRVWWWPSFRRSLSDPRRPRLQLYSLMPASFRHARPALIGRDPTQQTPASAGRSALRSPDQRGNQTPILFCSLFFFAKIGTRVSSVCVLGHRSSGASCCRRL